MKRFKIEQSTADIVSQGGLALIGQAINRYTTLAANVPRTIKQLTILGEYFAISRVGRGIWKTPD